METNANQVSVYEIAESGTVMASQFDNTGQELVTISHGIATFYIFDREGGEGGWEIEAQWDVGNAERLTQVHNLLIKIALYPTFSHVIQRCGCKGLIEFSGGHTVLTLSSQSLI